MRRLRPRRLFHLLRTLGGVAPGASTTAVASAAEPPAAAAGAAAGAAARTAAGAAALAAALLAGTAGAPRAARCHDGDNSLGADVEEAVLDVWREADEQLHRLGAAGGGAAAAGAALPRPSVSPTAGGHVAVRFDVPQALDVRGAVRQARRLLRSPALAGAGASSSSLSEEASRGPRGAARTFRRRSAALGDLELTVVLPDDAAVPALFEFVLSRAPGGGVRPADLALVRAVVLRAAAPAPAAVRDELGAALEGLPGGLLGGLLGGGLDRLRWMLEELEQQGGGAMWQDDDDAEPRPPQTPKRFDGAPGAAAPAPPPERTLQDAVRRLEGLGARVFLPAQQQRRQQEGASTGGASPFSVDWGVLAGYEAQKRAIEDLLLLPLAFPGAYAAVVAGTRAAGAAGGAPSARPRGVLLTGPPGCGKTTAARAVASAAAVPLVYLPCEAVASKFYGESEKTLGAALAAAAALPGGCILFLDELDSLATSRGGGGGGEMHEATRRLLGVLLRHMDGFDDGGGGRVVVVGATNRPQDLDAALRSRFGAVVEWPLPDAAALDAMLARYARQLAPRERAALAAAAAAGGAAGRDVRDACENAERRRAAAIARGDAPAGSLPRADDYARCLRERLAAAAAAARPGGA